MFAHCAIRMFISLSMYADRTSEYRRETYDIGCNRITDDNYNYFMPHELRVR